MLAKAMDNSKTTLAVVKLNRTRVSMNFQKPGTVGTRPTRGYTIPPNRRGGTSRNGRMSNKICLLVNYGFTVEVGRAHLGRKVSER